MRKEANDFLKICDIDKDTYLMDVVKLQKKIKSP